MGWWWVAGGGERGWWWFTGGGGDMDDDDDDRVPVNAHLQKDIEHLSRLESESGAAKVSTLCKVMVTATIV